MEEEQQVVNQKEQTATSTEQQQDQNQIEQTQEQEQTSQAEGQTQQQVDERGVDYRNVAMEYRRKLDEMPGIIQKTVQEALAVSQQQQQLQNKPTYTVSQLEQYAQENPSYRGWVEEQKALLLKQDLEKTFDERLKAERQQTSNAQVRQQTEQWVTSHPKFKDCFVTDLSGGKQWNMNNPLTQLMSNILNQQDPVTGKMVKDRPDGLAIAAEMAYGRYALTQEGKTQNSVQKLQKDLRKVQKQTMTVGTGVNSSSKGMSEYAQHKANYEKTYSKNDATAMTKSYLKSIGIIKEEKD